MIKKTGFTLAEVLITLAIIGIVAALTIPTLVANSQKTQYVTQLKKVYSTFNQALLKYTDDNGCLNDLRCIGVFDWGADTKTFGDDIVKYFNVARNCGMEKDTGCFTHQMSDNVAGQGGRIDFDSESFYKFITADGAAIMIYNEDGNCYYNDSMSGTGNLSQVCADVIIDVNGPQKGPNNEGRDIFRFYVTNGKGALLAPMGGSDWGGEHWYDDWGDGNQLCSQNGLRSMTCSGRVMEEGWQMNY